MAATSSIVILSGTWEFFDEEDFKGTKMATLGTDVYSKVTAKLPQRQQHLLDSSREPAYHIGTITYSLVGRYRTEGNDCSISLQALSPHGGAGHPHPCA